MINPLTPGAFCQKRIFWTFWRFSAWKWAKLPSIYSKQHLQHGSIPFFPLAPCFMEQLCLGMCRNQTFEMLDDKVTYVFRLLDFLFFFSAFHFSPFLIFLFYFYWACFQFKIFWESIIEMGKFYSGVDTCSCRQFPSEFFSQISEHFLAYFRLHWAENSDLGNIGKIFSSCRTWVQMMPILVKGDDIKIFKIFKILCFVLFISITIKIIIKMRK